MSKKKFFLIDDDDIICVVHPAIIRQAFPDCELEVLRSSRDAIEFIRVSAQMKLPPPDAVFLDINLPEMNGFDLLENLNSEDLEYLSKSRIFMLSSSIDQRDLERVTANPLIEAFVGKPLTVDFLKTNFK